MNDESFGSAIRLQHPLDLLPSVFEMEARGSVSGAGERAAQGGVQRAELAAKESALVPGRG